MWLTGALVIFAGMIADSVNNSGYTIAACKIASTTIVEFSSRESFFETRSEDKFRGLINIQYNFMTSSWIEVYVGTTRNATKTYLDDNYPKGMMIGCYVSTTNVRLTLFNHDGIILAGASIIVLSILASLIYLVILGTEHCRRKGYRDLDNDVEIKRVESGPPQL